MISSLTTSWKRTYSLTGVLLAVAVAIVAPFAAAKIATNTIDSTGVVADNGRRLIVTGPIEVTAGESITLSVTVTQRSTGAVAEGQVVFDGTGSTQQWQVDAIAHGRETFEAGAATVVAMAQTTSRGKATDAHQWLVNITLVDD